MGPAHTTNDTAVWLPDLKLLFSGDLIFNEGTPFVVMGSVAGSLEAVDRLRALGPETIVPGPRACVRPRAFRPHRGIPQVRSGCSPGRGISYAGAGPLEIARSADLARVLQNGMTAERLVGNIHRAFSEIKGRGSGAKKLEMRPIIAEMEAYNGGSRLSGVWRKDHARRIDSPNGVAKVLFA